jgi:hypothetical protein
MCASFKILDFMNAKKNAPKFHKINISFIIMMEIFLCIAVKKYTRTIKRIFSKC